MATEPVEPRRRATRIGEIVGLAAVVGSLIFVGLQVRQAAQATRGATQQQLSAAGIEVNTIMTDADFAAMFARNLEVDLNALDPVDRQRLIAYYRMTFRFYEDTNYQFRIGNLDPELWAGWKSGLAFVLELGGARDYWTQEPTRFNASFRALVDSIIAAQ